MMKSMVTLNCINVRIQARVKLSSNVQRRNEDSNRNWCVRWRFAFIWPAGGTRSTGGQIAVAGTICRACVPLGCAYPLSNSTACLTEHVGGKSGWREIGDWRFSRNPNANLLHSRKSQASFAAEEPARGSYVLSPHQFI
jgi:hypothetical protein